MEQSLKLTALGKYNLIASLAEGGMAKVYLGLMAGPAGFNKLLVIKVLNRDDVVENAEDNVQLFWDEARLAARVIHPNIVHTYEVGEVEGRYFLAMEYLDGQSYRTFQTRLAKSTQAVYEEFRIISETARGLHYAHDLKDFKGEPLGVVHRDVSPQNVFVTYDGQVKLLDFGIAKTYDNGHKTQVGVIKGKLDYIAPEQLSGDNVDHRADIFALGIMLYEAATGQRFAGGRKVAEVTKIHARLIGSEAKVRVVKPDIDEALAVIIDHAIALDPAQRWSDAGEFADALDAYIDSTGHRPTAKSLSEMMNKLFAEERRTMHKLIDQQIEARASLAVSGTTGNLPHLGWNNTITPSGVRQNVDRDLESTSSARGIPALTESPQPAASSRRFLGVAVVAGVTILLALAWLVPQRDLEPRANAAAPSKGADATQEVAALAPSSQETNAAEPANTVPQEESERPTVVINLKTWPADARVTLDGAEVPVPFSGEFRRGSALHHLEATAKGYQPYKKLINYDQDQSIEIVLQQQAPSRPRRWGSRADDNQPPPVAPEPEVIAAPPPPEPVFKPPTPGADIEFVKPRLKPTEIDTANPYSKKK